jgi:plastocyanin
VTIGVQPATPDFVVNSPGFFYTFSGVSGQNPQITLKRGRTYTFSISTDPSHPVFIDAPAGTVTNNNISNGTITFAVPTAAQNYSYFCSIHGFGNSIVTTP